MIGSMINESLLINQMNESMDCGGVNGMLTQINQQDNARKSVPLGAMNNNLSTNLANRQS